MSFRRVLFVETKQNILSLQPSERPLIVTEGYNICKPGTTGYILTAMGTISSCVCRYFSQEVGDFFKTTAKQRTVEITVKPLDTYSIFNEYL